MTHTTTPNDLLRFIYRETDKEESHRIKEAIACDEQLAAEFAHMMQTIAELDEVQLQPSDTSVRIVLEYSQQSVEEQSIV